MATNVSFGLVLHRAVPITPLTIDSTEIYSTVHTVLVYNLVLANVVWPHI